MVVGGMVVEGVVVGGVAVRGVVVGRSCWLWVCVMKTNSTDIKCVQFKRVLTSVTQPE